MAVYVASLHAYRGPLRLGRCLRMWNQQKDREVPEIPERSGVLGWMVSYSSYEREAGEVNLRCHTESSS